MAKRGSIAYLLEQQQKRELKQARDEEKRKKRLEDLKKKTELNKAKAKYNKSKRQATKSSVFGFKIKKKRQAGKISRKNRIRLF